MTDETNKMCEGFHDELAELALGVLTGRERAAVLAHLDDCPHCTTELEQLTATADGLLEIVPGVDPPVGFEVRVLDRLRLEQRLAAVHAPRRRLVARVVFVMCVAAAGLLVGLNLTSQPVPSQVSATPTQWATLSIDGRPTGEVLVYSGVPARFTMVVNDATASRKVWCLVHTKQGATFDLGAFWLDHGSGAWSSTLPVAASDVRSATLAGAKGKVLATATVHEYT